MNEEEIRWLIADMRAKGLDVELCDTPVPYFDNEVPCGKPNDVGYVSKDTMMLPQGFLDMCPEFVVRAVGDSMKDVNITEGDWLQVVTDVQVSDGDIVLFSLDGEYTVKTYCEDEEGHIWLVPQNENYNPIRLEDYDNVKIVGVVKKVTKYAPRVSYRSCMKIINNAKRRMAQQNSISQEMVSDAIRTIAPMVEVARQWYAVCRVLEDVNVVAEGDFDDFCQRVRAEVPEHSNLPIKTELQRMAVQSFRKPVALWNELNAPVQGKRFKDYVKLAEKMQELLEKD